MQGHTLDLVMTSGFPITNIDIRDAGLSNHLPTIFDCSIALKLENWSSTYRCRVINSSTATQFIEAFTELPVGVTTHILMLMTWWLVLIHRVLVF